MEGLIALNLIKVDILKDLLKIHHICLLGL